VLTSLYGGQPEEDGGNAEEDRRGRQFSGTEEVAKDPEAHTKHAGGDVRTPAKERGEDRAYCEKYADGAGDPAAEQRRAPLWYWIIARVLFRYRRVRVFAQNPLPSGGLSARQNVPGWGTSIIPIL
jgi:hypothetical protein